VASGSHSRASTTHRGYDVLFQLQAKWKLEKVKSCRLVHLVLRRFVGCLVCCQGVVRANQYAKKRFSMKIGVSVACLCAGR